MNNTVMSLAVDGSGNLYAGGDFMTAGGVSANYIAQWNGSEWSALGTGMNTRVYALAVDSSGSLYAGGSFTTAGGVSANYIAQWDGTAWSALGTGMNSWISALAIDSSGSLYAGGSFTTAGGVSANCIAKWDGSAWSALGTGMNSNVNALAVDGSGNLYAGGDFTTAGGVSANYIAQWNGSEWSALGTGMNSYVKALAFDGSGNLYAGGWFTTAGGVTSNRIALYGPAKPATQAYAVHFTTVTGTSMTVNWTRGDGANRIVLIKSGSAVDSDPVDGTGYIANTILGSGDQIGTGNYVVYSGTGNTVTVTGLTAGTNYHVAVYEFNGSGGTENYLTSIAPASGSTTTAMTPPGNALDFDGADDYVQVPDNPGLNITSALTLEAWINLNGVTDEKIISKYQTGVGGYVLGIREVNGVYTLQPEIADSSGTNYGFSLGNISLGQWTHVAMTFAQGGNLIGYINGSEAGRIPVGSNPIGTTSLALRIGNDTWAGGYWVSGGIDEVRIWNVARTQAEIQADMNKTLAGNESGLAAYYNFDHASGTTLNDLAGGDNNGTLTNMDPSTDWISAGWCYGCPYVSTDSVSSITQTTASVAGTLIDAGLSAVTATGLCCGTTPNPTSPCTSGGFPASLSGLTPGETYYARAYAANSSGTGYGADVTFTTGMTPPGNALDFDGVDDYVLISTESDELTGTFTVEAWAMPNHATAVMSIMGSRIDPFDPIFDFKFMNGNQIHGDIGDGSVWLVTPANADFSYSVGQWYHIAYVVTTSGYSIYINGALKGSGTFTGVPILFKPDRQLKIGQYGGDNGEWFKGQIDEVRIWNTARTQEQIQQNLNTTLAGNETGLVAYYNFDHISGTILTDLTANAYHGTLTNGPVWIASTAFNVWTGATDTNWETAGNWSRGTVPTASDNVYIAATGTQPRISTTLQACNHLVIEAGKILTIDTNDSLTVTGNVFNNGTITGSNGLGGIAFSGTSPQMVRGAFTGTVLIRMLNPTTLILGSDMFIPNAFFMDSGSIDLNGYTLSYAALAKLIYTGSVVRSTTDAEFPAVNGPREVIIWAPGGIILHASRTINKSILISSGATLNANNFDLVIGIAWGNQGGTFIPGTGTVTFNGTDSQISGTNTFYNLTKTAAAASTLYFTAGETQTITGTLNLQGVSGGLLSLRSDTPGTQWNIDPQGTRTVSYVDVQDSNNINAGAITAFNSTNSGNNINWTFLAFEPTVQASGLSFSGITNNSLTVNWTTNGDGANRIVVMKPGSAIDANPVDGTTYTANATFGSGSQIGTGNYVVYNGTGSSVTVTGLTAGTTYYIAVYEFNGSGGSENYLNALPLTGFQATNSPSIISVTSSLSDGNYGTGAIIPVNITFSEPVNVTGTPNLTLETGTIDASANYSSGSGSSTLTFNYTVSSGHSSADLDYVSTVSLALNSGTIKNSAGNDAVLILPVPGALNSLGANKNIVIETTAPAVNSFARQTPALQNTNADTLVFRVTFSENVQNIDTGDFAVSSISTAVVTGVIVITPNSVFDVTISGGNLASFNGSAGLNLSLTQNISDTAGNPLPSAEPGTDETYIIDNTAPAVTINQAAAQTDPASTSPVNFTVVFSESVTGFTDTGISLGGTAGALTKTLTGSGTSYNVAVSGMTGSGTVTASVNSMAAQDSAGNSSQAGTSTDNTVYYNNAPSISGTYTFTPINEDTASIGVQVSTVLADTGISLTESNGDTTGIAVTAITGIGIWQFSSDSTDGIGGTWTPFNQTNTPSDTTALLLNQNAWIRYVPDGLNGETASITFRAWDQTTGTASISGTASYADTSANGGTSAFSSTTAAGILTINTINDIPTLTAFASAVDTTNEDTEVEITFTELAAQGNEADIDGTVTAFVVKAVSTGTLKIGTASGTATAWEAGTNDTIDSTNNAYWTPALNQNGILNTFSLTAKDNLGAESLTAGVIAQVSVTALNDPPTLTAFASFVDTTNEDTEAEITFAELTAQGNEADIDGTITAFVVKAVSTGTLKIGTASGTAAAWEAGTNDTIDSTNNAYWTPALNQNGILNTFSLTAKDNLGAESLTAGVIAQVSVTALNDPPTLTAFASFVDTTNEDTEAEITFAELTAQGNEADIDGTITAFVVKAVSTGTLKIGTASGTATAWEAGTNDTIDSTNNAYWTPALNQNGILNTFALTAKDNLGAESLTAGVIAQVSVTALNDPPTLTAFASFVDTTNEDTEVEITFTELATQGDEADLDGTVTAFVVKAVSSGTLKIGADSATATGFVSGTNDIIDSTNNAYWTSALNQNGILNAFEITAKDNLGAESIITGVIAQVSVTDLNDPPTLTAFASFVDTTNEDTEVEITFTELSAQGDEADLDGTVTAFVVKAVSTGTLKIGADSATATGFVSGTNDIIDSTKSAYWTPADNANGILNALEITAKDNSGAESITTGVIVQVSVTDLNDPPTLTAFGAVIDTTAEDTEVEITFTELAAQGNEADIDGTVTAFVVKAVSTGTLKIGTASGTATAWEAGIKDTIDSTNNAYWTPALNQNGILNAFALTAKDNMGAESITTGVITQVSVTDLNDPPTLTAFASFVDTTNEDTEVEITFTELAAQGNEADLDGTVTAFVVKAVSTGTLKIGTDSAAALPFVAGTNDIIDSTKNAYWTPTDNANGILNALEITAKDNIGAESITTGVIAQVSVTDLNDPPTLTAFGAVIDTTAEDTEVEITFTELSAQGDEADLDGTVTAFVVKAVSTGTLKIGADSATATGFVSGTNDIIDSTKNAYWTPADNANGILNALELTAKDNLGAESITTGVIAQVSVTDLNDPPTLTAFASFVDTTNEDTEVEITFTELATQGDEADLDGIVTAFVVKAVSTGTLKIGTASGTATAWEAGTNDTIDSTNNAYWTPALNQNGILNTFALTAKDNMGAESLTAGVIAQVSVTDLNDPPTLTAFASFVDTTDEDTEVEITFADLAAHGNEADLDGTVTAFVVKAVSSGTLKIGADSATAPVFAAGANDIIDSTNNAYWTSALNQNGILNAFALTAKDNLGAESLTAGVIAQVSVTDLNDPPTLTAFAGAIDTANEDTEVEITFTELSAQGDEADADGTVTAFVVKAVSTGTLKIGTDSATALPFAAGTNDIIDSTNNAYWTPALNQNGILNAFALTAKDNLGAESITTGVIAQVSITDLNDPPTLTAFASFVDTTNEDTEVEITFTELATQGDEADLDGTVTAFVVKAVSTGILKIGTDSATALPFATGTNDIIDSTNNAYWTSALNQNGILNAFALTAKDNLGAESLTAGVIVQVSVTALNDPPTLTAFASFVDTTPEDTEVEITFTDIETQGNEADIDGTVTAFVVKVVSTGTLKIGTDSAIALPFATGTNDTIDSTNNAYWTPALNQNGILNAFALTAKDNMGAESITTGVIAQVSVTDLNDPPTLTAFASFVDTTNEDTEVEITFTELAAQGDEADLDGTVIAFVVKALSTGILKIGTDSASALPFAAGTNDTIDSTNNAYWTPALNQNGILNAFALTAKDNLGAESITTGVIAHVSITDLNDPPTLTAFASFVDTTNEDTEVEITFTELAAQGDEADLDGTVIAFVVKALSTGILKIGTDSASALPFAAGTNDIIDSTNNAYWTPALNQNGILNAFALTAKDNLGAESITTGVITQVSVTDLNDPPTLTAFASFVDTTNEDTEVEITFTELATQGDEADLDGIVTAFVVKAVSTGTLKIGTASGTATAWEAGTNDTIDSTNNAYWTPALNQNGILNAFALTAQDNMGAESLTAGVIAQVSVTDLNDPPTLTAFASFVDTTNEDTEAEITFAELTAQGNEADIDGTITAFVVKAVSTGTLKIGTASGTATAWEAGTNDTIDSTNNAYWTPALNQNGILNAFALTAQDNMGAESLTAGVIAQVSVTDLNDPPTLTAFASFVDTTDEDTEVEITFADLAAHGNEADLDGTVTAFVVKAVSSGTLKIGADSATAPVFAAGANDIIDSTNNAYWTSALNQNGILNAFALTAKDNLGAESLTAGVIVQVSVTALNDPPTLTAFASFVDTTPEDTEVEITFTDIETQGNEADIDGTVTAFVVKAVSSGTLKIGTDSAIALPFATGTNDTIDSTNNAYWTPALNQNGILNAFALTAKDNMGAESITTGVIAQVSVTDLNDPPTLTAFASFVDTTNEDTEVEITFTELATQGDEADLDGIVTAFVVKAVSTGTLKIGADSATATGFFSGTNDIIDSTNNAYWTSALNQNGILNAFALTAKDNLGAESLTAGVIAQVSVTDLNDPPTLTAFAGAIDTANEDTEVEITFTELSAQGDEADADGTVTAFVVKAVSTGTLKIGTDSATALPFAAGTNDIIDSTNNAYWTSALNQNGILNAFALTAKDNLGAESITTGVITQVSVTDLNDPPTLTAFGAVIDTTAEDTEVEITFTELAAQGDEADADGAVTAFVVKTVSNGTLKIGTDSASAPPFAIGTNDIIDSTKNAYWTPADNANGTLNAFETVVKDNSGVLSITTGVTAQVSVTLVNNIPTLTAFASFVDTANEDTEVEITLADLAAQGNEADLDGTITAFVVKAVSTGTLKIGADSAAATDYVFGSNSTINSANNAYWTPAVNANGTLNAFETAARDNSGSESVTTGVIAKVLVTAVNDAPSFTAVNPPAVKENAGIQDIPGWAAFTPGTSDESVQIPSYIVNNLSSPGLFAQLPSVDSSGSLIYSPASNVSGICTFDIMVMDNGGTANGGINFSPVQTFSIIVEPVNDPPKAVEDAYETGEDIPLTIAAPGLLINDSDPDNNSLTAVKLSDPSHGSVQMDATGGFTYTPASDYNGPDSFTYKTTDGILDSGTATVSLIVNPTNDPPAALNDTYTTNEDTPLTVSSPGILGNDTDVDGNSLTCVLLSSPLNGSLTFNQDGSFVYNPYDSFTGIDKFTYRASDGSLQSNPGEVSITVSSINDAPVLNTLGVLSLGYVNEDIPDINNTGNSVKQILSSDPAYPVIITDNDPGTERGIAVSAVNAENGLWQYDHDLDGNFDNFPGSISENAAVLLNLDSMIRFVPNPDFNGIVDPGISFRAWDGTSGINGDIADISINGGETAFSMDSSRAFIEVLPVNDAPLFTASNPPAIDEDSGNQVIMGWASFIPGPANEDFQQAEFYAVVNIENLELFAVIPSITPGGDLSYSSKPGVYGTSSFDVIVQDNGGIERGGQDKSTVQTFTITVNPVNNAPAALDDNYASFMDTPLVIDNPGLLSNDYDLEGSALDAVKMSDPSNGTLILNKDGGFIYTPSSAFTGMDSFTYQAFDGTAYSGTASVYISVQPASSQPAASNDEYNTKEDTIFTIDVPGILANDLNPLTGPLTAVKVSDPSNGTLVFNSKGSFTYTPLANFNGTDSFTYKADNGSFESDEAMVKIHVEPVNDAPAATNKSFGSVEDTLLNISLDEILFNNTDAENDPLTPAIVSNTQHGLLVLGGDGSLTYTPDADFTGNDFFTYKVNDGFLDSNTAVINIAVSPVNDAPVLIYTPNLHLNPIIEDIPDTENTGTSVSSILASDPAFSEIITDPDEGSLKGIAVKGVDNTYGKWQYNHEPDGVFNDFPADISEEKAVLLIPESRVRFIPMTDFNGLVDSGLYFRAWDQTAGNNGDTNFNIISTGGSTPFSLEYLIAYIDVIPVNDAPSFTAVNPPAVKENAEPQYIAGWAVFNPGPDDEYAQVPSYIMQNLSNPGLFTQLPYVENNGDLTYAPASDVSGTCSFDIMVMDNGGTANGGIDFSPVQTFSIIVDSVNKPPQALDDNYEIDEDNPLTIAAPGLLINDIYPDGAGVTAVKLNEPANGTAEISSSGEFTYIPDKNYYGTDSFTYKIDDGFLDSLEAVVTITVLPVNDAPVLNPDLQPVLESIAENNTENTGTAVLDIIPESYMSDPENGMLASFAVTGVDNTNGTWQYSIDNGAVWNNFTDITGMQADISADAVLLDGSITDTDKINRIRFIPDTDWYGKSSINLKAWDKSEGAAGERWDVSNDKNQVFSLETAHAFIEVISEAQTFFTLNISVTPPEAGTISFQDTLCTNNCSESFPEGTALTFTASASSGYVFSRWEGDFPGTSGSLSMTVAFNASVSAVFEPQNISYDNCPDDPNKTEPGECGCGIPDTDTDNDGTYDCKDKCPNDPNKTEPGECGCGIPDTDTDNDGTYDCKDKCPNDPNKTEPGECGCGIPEIDCEDACPDDPDKTEPGECGCGIADTDKDNDGTPDCNDNCPDDPDKIEPGKCGCGIPETECEDACPDDPDKTEPGECGCGIADTDKDNDGTPDCKDNCPDDPDKIDPGECGCGIPETPDCNIDQVNKPASHPVVISPENGAVLSHENMVLKAGAFSDPEGDTHVRTNWFIRQANKNGQCPDENPYFDHAALQGDLTSYKPLNLEPGAGYIWKVGYTDSGSREISWSEEHNFRTGEYESINIKINPGTTEADFPMISFPFWPDNPLASAMFGKILGEYDTRYYKLGTYDPVTGQYIEYSSSMVIEPGRAYWFFAREGLDIDVKGIKISEKLQSEVKLYFNPSLGYGWNMIAPSKNCNWNNVKIVVYDSECNIISGPSDISESSGYIDSRLWRWENGGYESDTLQMMKNNGYWVKVMADNVYLKFPSDSSFIPESITAKLMRKIKNQAGTILFSPGNAIADSSDQPPAPPSFSTSDPSRIDAGGGGCFIDTVNTNWNFKGLKK
ncbi:Immunoglobulin-like fold-containing protein [Desulfonema limicola]|uniref:Immunoglobulin-like fold-containing protein n=2 Tax=Desulfonema limicola TaxID=45656 RepID=A0A975GF60_9BACT|nr:Immunoglobulin-like fold-containing protein [Desulfonema limicola]